MKAFLPVLLSALLRIIFASASIITHINVVAIGFHQLESGYLSELDIHHILAKSNHTGLSFKAICANESDYNLLFNFVHSSLPVIMVDTLEEQLWNLQSKLQLLGFTLFMMNFKEISLPYTYCFQSSCVDPVNPWISTQHQHHMAWVDVGTKTQLQMGLNTTWPSLNNHTVSVSVLHSLATLLLKPRPSGRALFPHYQRQLQDVLKSTGELNLIQAYDTVFGILHQVSPWLHPAALFLQTLELFFDSIVTSVLLWKPLCQSSSKTLARQLTVNIYLVHAATVNATDTGPSTVELEKMQAQLTKLTSSFQELVFVVHRLDLSQDAVLSSALGFATQTTRELKRVVNIDVFRRYVIHAEISHQREHQELPVFWFYGLGDVLVVNPLKRSTHHVLFYHDMVLAIQQSNLNSKEQWEHGHPFAQSTLLSIVRAWYAVNHGCGFEPNGECWFWETDGLSTVLVDGFHRANLIRLLSQECASDELLSSAKQNLWQDSFRTLASCHSRQETEKEPLPLQCTSRRKTSFKRMLASWWMGK